MGDAAVFDLLMAMVVAVLVDLAKGLAVGVALRAKGFVIVLGNTVVVVVVVFTFSVVIFVASVSIFLTWLAPIAAGIERNGGDEDGNGFFAVMQGAVLR